MQVTLNTGSTDVLSLYTPFCLPSTERVEHTRSVLIQGDGKDGAPLTIISSVTFIMVISMAKSVPLDYLLKYMLTSYANRAYSFASKNSDKTKHAPLYPNEEGEISQAAKVFLRRIDRQNAEEYEDVVVRKGLFKAPDWRWVPAGSRLIEDIAYRRMRNLNFVRDIKQVGIQCNGDKRFKDDAQYRITFDNHLILWHFLNQFKRGVVTLEHKETKFECPITLLDPVVAGSTGGNRHEPFEGGNYLYYLEKQLNADENREFHTSLSFKEPILYTGGLLHPSSLDANDTLHLHEPNTLAQMVKNKLCVDNTGQRLTKKQCVANKDFRLRYNRFYIGLWERQHTHLEYFAREKMLIRLQGPVSGGQAATVVVPDGQATETTVVPPARKQVDQRAPTQPSRKNQPTLRRAVESIPEESKRKRDCEEGEQEAIVPVVVAATTEERPTKKLRVTSQKIDKFFTK